MKSVYAIFLTNINTNVNQLAGLFTTQELAEKEAVKLYESVLVDQIVITNKMELNKNYRAVQNVSDT